MKRMSLLVLVLAVLCLGACSSKHKAKKIETEIDKRERVGGEDIGLKDGNMVIQKKVMLAEDLRKLMTSVYELEDKVYGNQELGSWGLYGVLKECRKKLSSKEYGGDGKLMWIEKIDRVTDREEDLKIGLDEHDKLVAVKEEFLLDRIDRFKKYKQVLSVREIEMQDKVDICKAELESRKYEKKASQTN